MVANTVFATAPVITAPAERDSAAVYRAATDANGLNPSSAIDTLAAIVAAVTDGVAAQAPARREVSAAIRHRIPAGWYPDRENAARRRWWDGTTWTDHYSPVTAEVEVVRTPRHLAIVPEAPAVVPRSHVRVPGIVILLLVVVSAANVVALSLLAATH